MPTDTQSDNLASLYKWLDDYSIDVYPSEHRHHLGASLIGRKCWRQLWFGFRWTKLIQHDPRMRRLFNRGHEEEPRFIKILHWMGFLIRSIDPATDKQYKFSAVDGHYGGSGDTIAIPPWGNGDETKRILVEYKTHNNKSFEKLKKEKVKVSKPEHFAQMCSYGKAFNLTEALYCAINKDTDEIYFELIDLDWNYASDLERKANDIIYSEVPPPRIAENPAFFDCKYCDFVNQCFHGERVEVNCRSCKFARPVKEGKWQCDKYGEIPKEFLLKGCPEHEGIYSQSRPIL